MQIEQASVYDDRDRGAEATQQKNVGPIFLVTQYKRLST